MSVYLTCNAGSSNIKLATFDCSTMRPVAHATVRNDPKKLDEWLCSNAPGSMAIAHRVVHGGREFTQHTLITDEVIEKLTTYIPLAPLHQPAALKLIEETKKTYPDVPHIACFDTAFHHTMPDVQRRFALPRALHDEGIIRYGFHGLSYQHIVDILRDDPRKFSTSRAIIAHLGGGSSACAIRNFDSVATTMGFSTLDGLMMGTRSGAIDPGVLLYLLTEKNMSATEVSDILYKESGLKGVSGISSDMQELLEDKSANAQEAIELYCLMAAKQIAALLPALGGLDAIVFTGGIGENSAYIRDRITRLLDWIGEFSVLVIPTNEELVMAHACKSIIGELSKKSLLRWENEGGKQLNPEVYSSPYKGSPCK